MEHWFDKLRWRDPISGQPLKPIIACRDYTGRPLVGVLQVEGGQTAYPIVDGIPRVTEELANRYANLLREFGYEPPSSRHGQLEFQGTHSVESFGFQWTWDAFPRTEQDLAWRVAERFGLTSGDFKDRDILDAGCGAGDQSAFLLRSGARSVVSVDLSVAIEVAYRKMREHSNWVGIQGDLSALPFTGEQFDFVYCEGVIQHTRDSAHTVSELARVLRPGGQGVATHYPKPVTLRQRVTHGLREKIRGRLSRLDSYTLLFVSGVISSVAYIPVLGALWKRTIAIWNPRMPSFKATWACTHDYYGSHSFQRYLANEEFERCFLSLPSVGVLSAKNCEVRFAKGNGPMTAVNR